MWLGLLMLLLGGAVEVYVGWYIPRTMRRVRQRVVASSGDTGRLDDRMASRNYRTWMMAGRVSGVLLIALGTVTALGK